MFYDTLIKNILNFGIKPEKRISFIKKDNKIMKKILLLIIIIPFISCTTTPLNRFTLKPEFFENEK
jgi:hypothetical protein